MSKLTQSIARFQHWRARAMKKKFRPCFRDKMDRITRCLSGSGKYASVLCFAKGQDMPETPKSLSELMNELSSALTDLSDKMGSLTVVLENNYLTSESPQSASLMESAQAVIEKAKNE